MSQPVNTRSFSPASGTKSLIFGERPSVRLPSRMVPIWVSEPMGAGDSLAHGFDACNKCSGDGTHAGNHDPELSFGGCELALGRYWHFPASCWSACYQSVS